MIDNVEVYGIEVRPKILPELAHALRNLPALKRTQIERDVVTAQRAYACNLHDAFKRVLQLECITDGVPNQIKQLVYRYFGPYDADIKRLAGEE